MQFEMKINRENYCPVKLIHFVVINLHSGLVGLLFKYQLNFHN